MMNGANAPEGRTLAGGRNSDVLPPALQLVD